jgi:3D domain
VRAGRLRVAVGAALIAGWVVAPVAHARVSARASGGAPILGPVSAPPAPSPPAGPIPAPPGAQAQGSWVDGVTVTEYWPAPEAWFSGRLVRAPGLPGFHHVDWLYSATGVSMQGEGIDLDGQLDHLVATGPGGWVTAAGTPATVGASGTAAPFWRTGGFWRNPAGALTFPLALGGWSDGRGGHYVPLPGVRFAPGPATRRLSFYGSLAVDPSVIPLGSRVYVPAYRGDGRGGWFTADDTGGAIIGAHIDVYRPPPATPDDSGQMLTDQRIFVAAAPSAR